MIKLSNEVVTKPFSFEGPKRKVRANDGVEELKRNCDTLLVIPNETLLEITEKATSVNDSFKLADSVLYQATKGISDLINVPGLINLDFADVKTVMAAYNSINGEKCQSSNTLEKIFCNFDR